MLPDWAWHGASPRAHLGDQELTSSICRRKLKGDVNSRKVHFWAFGDVEMKLDEKIISYFESCNSPVDKEGFLYKKGEIKTSYQKRWFVLKGNLLFYKDRPTDRDLSEPGLRTYKFAAEDQSSLESWIKALLSASHSYLALLVADMEKKYREALTEFSSQPAKAFFMPNFNNAEAEPPAARSGLQQPSSVASAYSAAGGGLNSNLTFPTLTVVPGKSSPKLWPKRKANAAPLNGPTPSVEEWLEVCPGTKEEFRKLHEDFGKEVKELIADWLKRGRADEAGGENLIHFE
eukprot:XP_011603781.1 PREDICTED: sesquipedalian-1-like [Takifugu rubripes]